MAFLRRMKSSMVLKCLVLPALFLCAIFHKQTYLQWIAVGTVAVWLLTVVAYAIGSTAAHRKRKRAQKNLGRISNAADKTLTDQDTPESQLYLLRHINCRITEQLQGTYPMVSWLWLARPCAKELYEGGTWRIQTANTEPFNYADVTITNRSQLTITMLQAVSLQDAQAVPPLTSDSDLTQNEILDRVDVKQWYFEHGEQVLAQMIDELNTQGHKQLVIHDNGDVCINASGTERVVDKLKSFPPRLAWDSFCTMLKEDDISASVTPEGLMLSW
jgi:hypothetical protein